MATTKIPAGMHDVKEHMVKEHMAKDVKDDKKHDVKAHDVKEHLAHNPVEHKDAKKADVKAPAKAEAPKAGAKVDAKASAKAPAKAEAKKADAKAVKSEKPASKAPYVSNGQITVTLIKSTNGCTLRQIRTVQALGLNKISDSHIHNDNPAIQGMCKQVAHLVKVEKKA